MKKRERFIFSMLLLVCLTLPFSVITSFAYTIQLTGSVYDSLCAVNEQERVQWFGGPTRADVNEGVRDLSDVEAYCQEKE